MLIKGLFGGYAELKKVIVGRDVQFVVGGIAFGSEKNFEDISSQEGGLVVFPNRVQDIVILQYRVNPEGLIVPSAGDVGGPEFRFRFYSPRLLKRDGGDGSENGLHLLPIVSQVRKNPWAGNQVGLLHVVSRPPVPGSGWPRRECLF